MAELLILKNTEDNTVWSVLLDSVRYRNQWGKDLLPFVVRPLYDDAKKLSDVRDGDLVDAMQAYMKAHKTSGIYLVCITDRQGEREPRYIGPVSTVAAQIFERISGHLPNPLSTMDLLLSDCGRWVN